VTSDGEARLGLLTLVPIGYCGLPVLIAAGLGWTAFAWGGAVLAGMAVAGVLAAILIRRRSEPEQRGRHRDTDNDGSSPRPRPEVEVLYVDGCPNHVPALALIDRVAGEIGLEPRVRLVNVVDQEAAQRLRFLGSPTIRVGGRDVDPNTDDRADYGLSCRVFRTETGIAGQPDERWVRDALARERQAD
jgi:hypothetical protein